MSTYYWRLFADPERDGLARLPADAPREWRLIKGELRRTLGPVDGWDPDFRLHLDRPEPADFQGAVAMPFVVTERAKETIEPLLESVDEVLWLAVTLETSSGDAHRMYFLRPLRGPEFVDEAASKVGPGIPPGTTSITVAVFSEEKVGDRQLFAYAYGSSPVVSPRIRTAIEQAGLTGIEDWSPVPLT